MPTEAERHVTTDIPARLDRLPWCRWHWRVVIALGITWVLDGLEVTIVGALGPRLQEHATLSLSSVQVGAIGTVYLAGGITGALIFGYLTDKLGRKKLFLVTLGWYTLFTVLSAFSINFAMFAVFRFLTGMGIGGEYSAINSAVDELIPARRRGWTDLSINSSWWIGTAVGSAMSLLFLDPNIFPVNLGWRICFAAGASIAIVVLYIRRMIPESPRWLMVHGRHEEAKRIVAEIEEACRAEYGELPEPAGVRITIDTGRTHSLLDVVRTMLLVYPGRTFVALTLMITQAFLYNAIFFTYTLVLSHFFRVSSSVVGLYILPFAVGNFLGPWVLGHLFDVVGRKTMIAGTYILSGILLAITGWLFAQGVLNALTITMCWSVVFFFASAAASSAYLTASEVYPLEIRAMAIAVAYVASAVAGAVAPLIFGVLIASGSVQAVFGGYLVGAFLMIVGGVAEAVFGVSAERKSLEEVALPLSALRREKMSPGRAIA